MDEPYRTIRTEACEDGTVLRIVLDNAKGNIVSMAMMDELDHALAAAQANKALRLVLLRGAGGNFSFGASVPEHVKDKAPAMLARFHGLARKLAASPVPIAAVVEGRCLGGAFEIVLCCHFVFAAENAKFACPEIKLGVLPPVLAVLGSRRLGGPIAERLLLTGDELDAQAAERCGFATAVLAKGTDAEAQVLEWYRQKLRPLSAFAIRQGTAAVRQGSGMLSALGAPLEAAERRYLSNILPSHDGNEGIEAFLARREPAWENA